MRVVLAADEAAGVQVLRALDRSPHEVVAVLAPERATVTGASLSTIARSSGLPTWPAEWVLDPKLCVRLEAAATDVVLNVHSLYRVHEAALEAPRFGWFNLHPGLLPDYAGLNTTSWAIANGEATHGVTVHRMDSGIDAGPIAYEERFPIGDEDTGLSLSAKCTRAGVRLMLQLTEALDEDPTSVPARPQDASVLRYFKSHERPLHGPLDWAQPSAVVSRLVRAYDFYPLASPWGVPMAILGGREVGVLGIGRTHRPVDAPAGHAKPGDGGTIEVACADEWVQISRVSVDDRIVPAASLLDDHTSRNRANA